MEKRIYIRVPEQLLKDFDAACEANYTTKSEVLRRAMVDYVRQNQKGEEEVKKIEVVIIEAGLDYTDRLESFEMEVPKDKDQAVAEAIEAVEARGYNVIPNDQGGCNEFVSVTDGEDYIAITVEPK